MLAIVVAALGWVLAAHLPLLAAQEASGQPGVCRHPEDPTSDNPRTAAARAAACRAVLQDHPDSADAYLVLAMAMRDDSVAKLEVLEAGRRAAPEDCFLQANAGLTLRRFGRLEEAMAALERSATLCPSDAFGYREAAVIATEVGQLERAHRLLTEATARDPRDGSSWGYLARVEAATGRHADAVRHWERAQQESGYTYLRRSGDRELYERSLALAPEAHVEPPQLARTLRLLALLAVPVGILLLLARGILRWGRTRWPARTARLFLALLLVHFGVSWLLGTLSIGAAFAANRGMPPLAVDRALGALGVLLLAPISLAQTALPERWAPDSWRAWLLLNSVVFAAAVVVAVAWWRSFRSTNGPGLRATGGSGAD